MVQSDRKLKIAQLCTLWEQVPPKGYGGIELVASVLTEELVKRGHEVTLFASGDSNTGAKLHAPCDYALRHDPTAASDNLWRLNRKNSALEQLQLKWLYEHADEFDVIHSHLELSAFAYAARSQTPTIHTMHMDLIPETIRVMSAYADQNFVSISDAQREPCPLLNYVGTVYNAIDLDSLQFFPQAETPEYLAFLGRLSPEKGIHHAIEISKKTGIPLKVAGKFGQEDAAFYESEIKPHLDGNHIQILGELTHEGKNELLGNAIATLFPITWREPFGLVMVESMACGTPVLGMNMGSVPEVIDSGQTGFICDTVDEMVACIPKIKQINRQACRDYVERRFSIQNMVDGYEAVYHKCLT